MSPFWTHSEPLHGKRPNIILVMTDDQGYGDLGCTGNPLLQTPNIDAFSRTSVRFTNFHVSPTCAPTRAALMTGRHEFKSGVTHTIYERERLSLKATTIAQVLKSAGYTTGIFGKWHLGDEPDRWPDKRGFDEMFIHGAGGIGQTYPGSCGDAPDNSYFNPAILHNGRFVKTQGFCTDLFFQQAIQWIGTPRTPQRPFFAYITPNAPHAPLDCPPEYIQRYSSKTDTNTARFFGLIENIDENFGRLLNSLRDRSLDQNTLVIFMTDNGGTAGVKLFNAGMRGGKGTPYQGATRVPSLWRWPAAWQSGRDCAALTAHIDLFQTLSDLAGASLSPDQQRQSEGRSLLPLLEDPNAAWADRHLVTHVGRWPFGKAESAKFSQCSIRNQRYSLVNNSELFDLASDPGQKTNLIHQFPAITRQLRDHYERWWTEILPALENESVIGPAINPFKALFWQQFGGQPDPQLLQKMDPAKKRS